MRKILPVALGLFLLLAPRAIHAQSGDPEAAKNAAQARAALDTMVQALQDGFLGVEYRCEPNKVQIG